MPGRTRSAVSSVRRSTRSTRSTRVRATPTRRISFGSVDDESLATTADEDSASGSGSSSNGSIRSPGQRDAFKDAAVYMEDACFSHALGDEPEHFHYHGGHSHSHGGSSQAQHEHVKKKETPSKEATKPTTPFPDFREKKVTSKPSNGAGRDRWLIFFLFFLSVLTSLFAPQLKELMFGPDLGLSKSEISNIITDYLAQNSAADIARLIEGESAQLAASLAAQEKELADTLAKLRAHHDEDVSELLKQIDDLTKEKKASEAALQDVQSLLERQLDDQAVAKLVEDTLAQHPPALDTSAVTDIVTQELSKQPTPEVVDADAVKDAVLAALGTQEVDADAVAAAVSKQFDARLSTLDDGVAGLVEQLAAAEKPLTKADVLAIVTEWYATEKPTVMSALQNGLDAATKDKLSTSDVESLLRAQTSSFLTQEATVALITSQTASFLTKQDVESIVMAAAGQNKDDAQPVVSGQTEAQVNALIAEALAKFTPPVQEEDTKTNQPAVVDEAVIERVVNKLVADKLKSQDYVTQTFLEKYIGKTQAAGIADQEDAIRLAVENSLEDLAGNLEVLVAGELEQALASKQGGDAVEGNVADLIDAKLAVYDADRTGKVDYAMYTSGGKVVDASPDAYFVAEDSENPSVLSLLWDDAAPTNPPRTMLTSQMDVGSCWPMGGDHGWALIQLRDEITVSSVSLEHIAKGVSPTHSTAPKKIKVWGVRDPAAATDAARNKATTLADAVPVGDLLVEFEYDNDAMMRVQEHATKESSQSYRFVTLQVESNYGHPVSTCIYRFRVHGSPAVTN